MFHNKVLKSDDEYMTPKKAWEDIKEYIPNSLIWEAFNGDGSSASYLKDMGYNVINDNDDFFNSNKGDIIITNPPFTKSKEVIERLKQLDKPFIIILPCYKLSTSYLRNNFNDTENNLQIIIPRKRIQFIKNNETTSKCNFDCYYYCYKMKLPRDIIWLH